MCGRYVSPDEGAIERAWNLIRADNPFATVFNAAPTMPLPILRLRAGERELCAMHWGLVPYWWSKPEPPHSTINARVEEAATKPMWRDAARHSRCLVPALGWYEWQAAASGRGRQPFYIHRPDRQVLCFAGLWSERPRDAAPRRTFAILTRPAAGTMADLHTRMPLVLAPGAWEAWLDPDVKEGGAALACAQETAETAFQWYPVSSYVNSPRNQGEACVAPAA